jgi:hypothetical protein
LLFIQGLKKGPEHETFDIFANSDAQKGPGARDCLHFLLIQMLKKAPEHETVGIFANAVASKGPGA